MTLLLFPTPAFGAAFTLLTWAWMGAEAYNMIAGRCWELGNRPADRGSYWLLLATVGGSLLLGYAVSVFRVGALPDAGRTLGLGLMLGGGAFRQWAIALLGRHFSVLVTVDPDQRLITRGPYRRLRHPSYTGALITILGFGLALGSALGLALVWLPCFAAFAYRAHVEEQALLAAFGDEYRAYMRRTWRFFPGY